MQPPPQFIPLPKKPTPKPPPPINSRTLALSVTLTLALFLSIGIPLGAIIPSKYVRQLPLTIILPLYIYPEPGAWDLLFDTILRNKDQQFLVIVNPSNGPSPFPKPNPPFLENIQNLDLYPNVQKLGYISTDGGTRSNTTLLSEIEIYANWNRIEGLAVHGIYFDQTPIEDTPENRAYLRLLARAVKNATGIQGPRLVARNPGMVPNTNLTQFTSQEADLTILYEGPFADVPSHNKMKTTMHDMPGTRENYGCLVHSAPRDVSRPRLRKLINEARKDVGYLMVTDRSEKPWEGWSGRWWDFWELVPS